MRAEKPHPKLIAFTDLTHFTQSMSELSALCKEARERTVAIVLRDRTQTTARRYELGRGLRAVTRDTGQYLFVADRFDLFLALEADGIHLGGQALMPSKLRPLVPWLSRSNRDLRDLLPDEIQHLDAIFSSPAFAELKGRPALGREGLKAELLWLQRLRLTKPPLTYALGAVNADNATIALSVGCAGVGTISAVIQPESRSALLNQIMITRSHTRPISPTS